MFLSKMLLKLSYNFVLYINLLYITDQDKDIYLLDDPLAAVDSHVASHLFHHCIMGILNNKTRILCTHHTKFLKDADVVVVMDEGRIIEMGNDLKNVKVYLIKIVHFEVEMLKCILAHSHYGNCYLI